MSISRTTATARAACAVVAVLLAFVTSACRDTGSTTQPTISASASAAVHTGGSALKDNTAGRYVNRRDVCSALNHMRLTRELGVDGGNSGQPRFSDTNASSIANCSHQYGPGGMRSLISLEVMISKLGSARRHFTEVSDAPSRGQPRLPMCRDSASRPPSTPTPRPARTCWRLTAISE